MPGNHEYEKVHRDSLEDRASSSSLKSTDEEQDLYENIYPSRLERIRKQFSRRRLLASISICALLAIVACIVTLIVQLSVTTGRKETRIMNLKSKDDESQHNYLNPPQPDAILTSFNMSCGNTARIARSRGCIFDVMSFAWVPGHCVDLEMQERYISERTWEWYEDYAMTKKLSIDVVRAGEYRWTFSSQSYHIAHCIYTWDRQGKFLFANKREDELWIDEGSFEHPHTTHCINYILNKEATRHKTSTIWNEIADCRVTNLVGTL